MRSTTFQHGGGGNPPKYGSHSYSVGGKQAQKEAKVTAVVFNVPGLTLFVQSKFLARIARLVLYDDQAQERPQQNLNEDNF